MNVDVTNCQILFGQYIKTARERKKWNQLDLAERVGISQSYLSYIETGNREVDLVMAIRLCEAVDMDIRDFVNKCL